MGNTSAGVGRPMNLVDVINTLNQQSTALNGSQQMVTALGAFSEADETLGMIDSATALVNASGTRLWDGSTNWGAFTWS